MVTAFAFEVGVECFTYQGESASDCSLGSGGEVGIGGDGLLDDFIVENHCVVEAVAYFVAVFDVLCDGVTNVLGSSSSEVCVGGIDEICDGFADEFSDFVPRTVWYGCGFGFVYVVWVHVVDATRAALVVWGSLLCLPRVAGIR